MNKGIRKAALTLVAVCLLFVSIINLNIVDTKALDKYMVPVRTEEKLSEEELEEMIIEVDLDNDYRSENEVSLEELEEKAKAAAEAKKNVKELTIEELIGRACQEYGVPFDLALAIARYETGWFKSYAFRVKNNPGGLSRNEVPMRFDSIEEGVDAFVGNLSRNYIEKGLTTPKEIGKKYCPVNPEWYKTVEVLMTYER